MSIQKVAVVGAGLMGHAIAQEIASAGHPVTICDISQDALEHAVGAIGKNLEMAVKLQLVEQTDVPGILERITTTTQTAGPRTRRCRG